MIFYNLCADFLCCAWFWHMHCAVCWMQSQVEIKLKKAEGWRWEKLENDGSTNAVKQFNPGRSVSFRVHTDAGKSWNFVEFKVCIFQAWKILESRGKSPPPFR